MVLIYRYIDHHLLIPMKIIYQYGNVQLIFQIQMLNKFIKESQMNVIYGIIILLKVEL
jgi:hypothetical protein